MCGCFGKLFALLIGAAFICYLPVAIWSFNLTRTGYQEETYLKPFAEQDFYENVTPFVLPEFAKSAHETDLMVGELRFENIVDNLNQDDWNAIAQEVVPPDYLQEQVENNLTVTLAYLRGDRSRLDVDFNTKVVRDNLLGQPGDRMVNRIFSSWEQCTEAQETQLRTFLEGGEAAFPYCKPQDADLQRQVFTKLNNSKDQLASEIPERWNARLKVAENRKITLDEADDALYLEVQRPNVLTRELFPLNFLISAGLLALVVIFAVNSGKTFFRWMGWLLTSGGIAALLPLGIVPLLATSSINSENIHSIEAETIRGVALSLVSEFTQPILVQGALLVAVGFLMVFLSILMPNPDDRHREEEAARGLEQWTQFTKNIPKPPKIKVMVETPQADKPPDKPKS